MEQAKQTMPKIYPMAEGEAIDPLFNDAFVHVFGREESKVVTRGLVNSILREVGIEELGEINEIHSEHTDIGEAVGCKGSRFDVLVVADERRYIVDIEAERHSGDIANRALLYGCRIMSTYTQKGMGYDDLPHVIVMVLLDAQRKLEGDGIVTTASFKWQLGASSVEATDRLQIVLVDLAMARKRYNRAVEVPAGDEMAAWLYALTRGYKEKKGLVSIMEKFPSIEEFAARYNRAVSDPAIIAAYEAEADNWRERESRERWLEGERKKAQEEGHKEGLEQGLEQGLELASSVLREQGVEESTIAALRRTYVERSAK